MSGFKTKKLPQTPKPVASTETSSTPTPPIKKRNTVKWVIGTSMVVSVLIFGIAFTMNITKSNVNNGTSEKFEPIAKIAGELLTAKKEGTTNVLIAGIGGRGHEGSDLTDSIMLASLNADEDRVTLLSIPRDLYVAYPGGKGAGRINSLYQLGKSDKVGVKYLAEKVAEITGQQIDHYVVIDFSGFKKIIDVIGGIEVNVPTDLIDREYPDDNWGYETLVVRKGLQTMDGELALKYARSRHSTSDFDRSNRQQLIIKAIKEKLFGSETVTSPTMMSEIFSTVMDHLDTDMSLSQMAETVFANRKIQSENIKILSLSNECTSLKQCSVGGYLYNPSRDLFGGASVIIPENARVNKLSYYDDIRRFVDITFRFPGLTESPHELILVSSRVNNQKAKNIGLSLAKMGFKISTRHQTIIATGAITQSHVNIYWHEDLQIGIDPKSPTIEALKYLEESLPYITVQHNEYVTDDGPKIEIVLGDDMEEYFPFVTPTYYIPAPPPSASGTTNTGSTISGERTISSSTTTRTARSINASVPTAPVDEKPSIIEPGEWEDFGN